MTVEQPQVLDFVWVDKDKPRVYLAISDHLDWDNDEQHHLEVLHEKIQNYLYYLDSGQLAKSKPDWKNFPVTIHVRAKHALKGEGVKFYEVATEFVADAGFTLEFEHAPGKDDAA